MTERDSATNVGEMKLEAQIEKHTIRAVVSQNRRR